MASQDGICPVDIYDDGTFVRTALPIVQDNSISFDIIVRDPFNNEKKTVVARINVFYFSNGEIDIDVISPGNAKDVFVKAWDYGKTILDLLVKSPVAVILKEKQDRSQEARAEMERQRGG